MKPTAPCKGCERREIGCHVTCEEYKAYEVIRDEWNKAVYNARHNEAVVDAFRATTAYKVKKCRKKGGKI